MVRPRLSGAGRRAERLARSVPRRTPRIAALTAISGTPPVTPRQGWSATVTACAFRADAQKIGLAGVEDEPSGLCDSTDVLPSLSGAVLRLSAPRQRVPSLRARHCSDAELRAGHRRKTPADRLHLGSIFNSRGGRRREGRCLAASHVRLHPPLAGGISLAFTLRVYASDPRDDAAVAETVLTSPRKRGFGG
jgi:hypothetical protein